MEFPQPKIVSEKNPAENAIVSLNTSEKNLLLYENASSKDPFRQREAHTPNKDCLRKTIVYRLLSQLNIAVQFLSVLLLLMTQNNVNT